MIFPPRSMSWSSVHFGSFHWQGGSAEGLHRKSVVIFSAVNRRISTHLGVSGFSAIDMSFMRWLLVILGLRFWGSVVLLHRPIKIRTSVVLLRDFSAFWGPASCDVPTTSCRTLRRFRSGSYPSVIHNYRLASNLYNWLFPRPNGNSILFFHCCTHFTPNKSLNSHHNQSWSKKLMQKSFSSCIGPECLVIVYVYRLYSYLLA